ncbi:putative zinc metalloprotease [Campylobacterota bacterium]|nr:putative zinc metalloprotease [Campylobacterota bacterium]
MGIITAILVLSLLIFIHEFGHFIAARMMGVTVEVFSIGFGKTLLSRKIGATEYRVSAFLLGGYVRMKGQDDASPLAKSGEIDAYDTKKPWQRIFILFAGPFANFVLAFFLFWVAAIIGFNALAPTIGKVLENSPAEKAGLLTGDKVLQINGEAIDDWQKLSEAIRLSEHATLFSVDRGGEILLLTINPEMSEGENVFGEKERRKMAGIAPSGEIITLNYGAIDAVKVAWGKTIYASTLIFQSVYKLISGAIGLDNMGGIISIVDITAKASAISFAALLGFTALLSVNLGVLNLLPIPALDGGHIIFNVYEQIFRRPPNEKVLLRLTIAGWAILCGLMFLGLYNDVVRLYKEHYTETRSE